MSWEIHDNVLECPGIVLECPGIVLEFGFQTEWPLLKFNPKIICNWGFLIVLKFEI